MLDQARFARHFADLSRDGAQLQGWFQALEAKRVIFTQGDAAAMLQAVFTAKRRLAPQEAEQVLKNNFSHPDRKKQGAAQDFLAEWRHFRDPQAEPLATRWALDALRELGAEQPDAAAARKWLYEQLKGEGVYRDQHWWSDLLLARVYVEYLRAMTGGVLGSDFTRAMQPEEQLAMLLGLSVHAHT